MWRGASIFTSITTLLSIIFGVQHYESFRLAIVVKVLVLKREGSYFLQTIANQDKRSPVVGMAEVIGDIIRKSLANAVLDRY